MAKEVKKIHKKDKYNVKLGVIFIAFMLVCFSISKKNNFISKLNQNIKLLKHVYLFFTQHKSWIYIHGH